MASYDPNDPDMLYLAVDRKKLMKEQTGTFDAKKACWVPDVEEGFRHGEIQETTGEMITVKIVETNETKTIKKDDAQAMNPPKFEKLEDIANLTYLNEGSVLYNLKTRYVAGLIYTYSGLFCIAINPYRRLPIYVQSLVDKYRGKRKTEMPPHLFSIADNAYQFMVQDRENQSMLITGESGAGKTENTKKVIAYFALVAAASPGDKKEEEAHEKKGSLEDQIVQANPVLEAYGNAKTSRNNNSSRFGKFVRIHFASSGKIAGADIETYLLEKSRVTFQQSVERNYHIFYQMLSNAVPSIVESILCSSDPGLYSFINMGVLTVNGIDDVEEMNITHAAFDVLGFSEDEKTSCYKCTGSILHMGEMKFKQKGEQAEPDGTAEAEKVSFLLGVNCGDFLKALCKPKIKVAMDYVTQGRTKAQVVYSVGAMAKSLFDRVFNWLVKKVNKGLDTKKPRQFFIGVLDIAGFEIFEFNSFEQLCINYTNERLQQFFNHHMFVLEQEEYKKEGIEWTFIDFGMDLQACIELIERPLGILSILEEECMFPKASDKTFKDKLVENHMGKSPNFLKTSKALKGGEHGDFALKHYAGTVPYNIGGWLEKNKDPVNETIVQLLKQSKEPLVQYLFTPQEADAAGAGGGKKKKKSSAFQTISSTHRESLNKLMKNLYTTHPHFVRCIIPNETKSPGVIDANLVLHQLQCNGVLEGIRICRKGFPSRVIYSEFKQRYSILAPNAIPEGFVEGKIVSGKILEALEMEAGEYRLGNTKVFFKAGVLGYLEELRDDRLTVVISLMQAHVRGYLNRKYLKWLQDRRTALELIQKNIRKWLAMRNWAWWRFYTKVKPLLSIAAAEDEMKLKDELLVKTKEELEKTKVRVNELEEQNVDLTRAKENLFLENETMQDTIGDCEERIEQLLDTKMENESQIKDLNVKVVEEAAVNAKLTEKQVKMEGVLNVQTNSICDLEDNLAMSKNEVKTRDSQIKSLQEDMIKQDEAIAKLTKSKKELEDSLKATEADLFTEQDKNSQLNKIKQKLENSVEDLEGSLEREKRVRGDLDKAKRKLEQDLRSVQDTCSDLDRIQKDLEETLKRKEKDISNLNGDLEDSENKNNQQQRKNKELTSNIEELQVELENEMASRGKCEKQRAELSREIDEMTARLDEAGGANITQIEANKKLQNEIIRLKKNMDDANMQAETQLSTLKKRNQDAMNDLNDQIDVLQKFKTRLEKEKSQMKVELEDLQSELESAKRNKGSMTDVVAKQMQSQLSDLNLQVEESARALSDLQAQRTRLQGDNSELNRQLEDAERRVQTLSRDKNSLSSQVEEASRSADEELRIRQKLQAEVRNLNADLAGLGDQLIEEQERSASLERQLSKSNTEMLHWRSKYETEGSVKVDELEDVRRRLQARLNESEQNLESERTRSSGIEKLKARLQGEMDDMSIEVQQANANVTSLEKKQRNFDRVLQEYQSKVIDLKSELDMAAKEARGYYTELYRDRSKIEDMENQSDSLRRENKNLSEEILSLSNQVGDGSHAMNEIEKVNRRLLGEKSELQSALVEAEAALEQEEAKVMRAQIEISQAKADMDRRVSEKEEEHDSARRNYQRSLDSMQGSMEAEQRGKVESMRIRKKLEGEISDLEVAVGAANRTRMEAENVHKRYQTQARELQMEIEERDRSLKEAREHNQVVDRHSTVLKGEVDEMRTALESSERARKYADGEMLEMHERLNDLTSNLAMVSAQKRKQEIDISAMQTDLDEVTTEVKTVTDNYKRVAADAARLSDDLSTEQEHSSVLEKSKRTLENQLREAQSKLDGSDSFRTRADAFTINKLEQRVRDVEVQLDKEQQRHADTVKSARQFERRHKELTFQVEEEHKNQDRMLEIADKQNMKIRSMKSQIEEAEEIAANNVNRYRKAQQDFEEAQTRANIAEVALEKLRSKSRSVAPTSYDF